MAKIILHHSEDRGSVNNDWLQARYSFSFGGYFDPEKTHFGALRVLNEEKIAPKRGFKMRPHTNAEIVTLVFVGFLEYQDSLGNKQTLSANEMQVVSAGTGLVHSEKNPDERNHTETLQLWFDPSHKNIIPRYSRMSIPPTSYAGKLRPIVSPDSAQPEALWVHQKTWVYIGKFSAGKNIEYTVKDPKNGVYVFVLRGILECCGSLLGSRDAMGVWEVESLTISPKDNNTVILVIEVPI